MKKLSFALLILIAFASCDKKKNYCVCKEINGTVVDSREMSESTFSCAAHEMDVKRIYPDAYCQVETE